MPRNPLLIISIDAINAKDFAQFDRLPTFRKFIDEGAFVPIMDSVYPTVTYNCHASISTGRYPEDHGVFNNEFPQPRQPTEQDWRWYDWDVKAPTIFDYAEQAGLTVGTLLWPSTAGGDHKWNVPEIWSPSGETSSTKLYLKYGSKSTLYPVFRYAHLMDGKKQPALDNFTEKVTHYLLKKKHPDVLAVHFTEIDTFRHIYGFDSPEVDGALKSAHNRITRIMETLQKTEHGRRTNVVLLGDHGTADCSKIFEINSWLKAHDFLTTDDGNAITSTKAYGASTGGSCHIHCDPEISSDEKERLRDLLEDLVADPDSPASVLFDKATAKDKFRLTGSFDFILEASDGWVFKNHVSDQIYKKVSDVPGAYKGDHGYLPSHPYMKTMLMMMGPDIKKGSRLDSCTLVDLAPTFAELLGLTMEKVHGCSLRALLK